MKNKNNISFPNVFYSLYLETIQGIKFTQREIDVISCMLNGRASKKISSFLNISPRTVETHVRNVMNKLECHSRESIIDFTEKCDKHPYFKHYYSLLVAYSNFENILRNLSRTNQRNGCILVHSQNLGEEESFLLSQIKEHLCLGGIKVSLKIKKTKEFDPDIEFNSDGCILYVLSKDLIEKPQFISASSRTRYQNKSRTFYLFLGDGGGVRPDKSWSKVDLINFREQNNYYLSFFVLLKKILPNKDFDPLISEFKSSAERNKENLQVRHSEPTSPFKTFKRENIFSILKTTFFLKNKQKYLWEVSFFAIILFSVVFLLFKGDEKWKHSQKEEHASILVRSDLIVPSENALLDRLELLTQIDDKLKEQKCNIQTIALVGPGGAGKTTLARQYGRQQKANVLWEINAGTKATLNISFENLAQSLSKTAEDKATLRDIQDINNPTIREDKIIQFVKQKLRFYVNWFLIYDNVHQFTDIQKHFPIDGNAWGQGKVILTTQDSNIQNNKYLNHIVPIGELNFDQKLNLFTKIMNKGNIHALTPAQQKEARNFLKSIPSFPLDISIAAYYLRATNVPYGKYLENLATYNNNFANVQENLLKEAGDYIKTRYSIITLSIHNLINTHKDFRDLLLLTNLLDSQDIPRDMLNKYKDHVIVDNFIYNLKKYSFITDKPAEEYNENTPTISLHRSTQALGLIFLLRSSKGEEISNFFNHIIPLIRALYEHQLERAPLNNISLLPHLEVLKENLNKMRLAKEEKAKYVAELLFIMGYIHHKCTHNHILTKRYFSQLLEINRTNHLFPNKVLATLLKDLGAVLIYLGELDEGLVFCQESINLYKVMQDGEVFTALNLDLMGVAYSQKNNFDEAKQYFEAALSAISKVDVELKREIEAGIYKHLAWLYSKTYLNKPEAYQAEKYAHKALELLNASHLFYNNPQHKDKNNLNEIIRHKEALGYIYSRLGKYKEAVEQGFREAQYIIDHLFAKGVHTALKGYISLGIGEAFLREGNLIDADKKLTESIQISEKLIGGCDSLQARVYRAEARIRQGRLEEAFEDCLSVFKMEKKITHNYFTLMNFTNFYHAAIIKYKQGDLKESIEYFDKFFENMKIFCRSFLDEKSYNELNLKGVFIRAAANDKGSRRQDIEKCLQYSADIFSALYGHSHPFIQSYVRINLPSQRNF